TVSKRPDRRTGPRTSHASEGGRQAEPGIRRLDPQQGYDLWAATYDATPNVVVSMDARHTPHFLKTRAGERVLDAGCGTGRHLSDLAACGCRPVGVDFSAEMLRVARRRLPGVPLVQAALEGALPFI